MNFFSSRIALLVGALWGGMGLCAQKSVESRISDSLTVIANSYANIGARIKIQDLQINQTQQTVTVNAGNYLAYIPFRENNVARIYKAIRICLPEKYADYKISCLTENRTIEELIPNYYNPSTIDSSRIFAVKELPYPLVTNLNRPYEILRGLERRHIALWQSHGKYYDQKRDKWTWQRAHLFQTVEDLYTQSYVLPFLVPMLEHAGANVLLPRERDTQLHEVIVDNASGWEATGSRYKEHNERKSWVQVAGGFANPNRYYLQGENPFQMGSYKMAEAIADTDEISVAEWIPSIPEKGRYAVYVAYKTLPNSAEDAIYTVYHSGYQTRFRVNQTMGGGTWIYLGHFDFEADKASRNRITLTNYSTQEGKVITADAVKIGGGMGNIARYPSTDGLVTKIDGVDSLSITPLSKKQSAFTYKPAPSGYPRYIEGARYWLQWAGVPDSVYCRTGGANDYSDDFQSRGFWVNYLAGGSSCLPDKDGLHIPVDMALAFHSDAGSTGNNEIIGTLGITTIPNTQGSLWYANAVSRWASRDLTDMVMTQIVDDVQRSFAPEWMRRGLWNKSYSESRVPEVPTMLLELLSHQNVADMRYGLDPRFRFTVSRAIYKGVLRYLCSQNKQPYIIQPLPVENFSTQFVDKSVVELHWQAVTDSLEATALPEQYRLYTRIDDGEFDNGVMVRSNTVRVNLIPGKIYSFKVSAVNKGGESFPSEILSACRLSAEKGKVLVINGFDRLAAPVGFEKDSANFKPYVSRDPGVAYLSDISYVGMSNEFKDYYYSIWPKADSTKFSRSEFETAEIAGNSFDYPYVHGKALRKAGYSFVSTSLKSVTTGYMSLKSQKNIDLILGKQKQTTLGNAKKAQDFKTFPLALQQSLTNFCQSGGNLLLSGAFIGSDMTSESDCRFCRDILHYKYNGRGASAQCNSLVAQMPMKNSPKLSFSYFNYPNPDSYCVEAADAILPTSTDAVIMSQYGETNKSAGIAYRGKYKVCALGFPLESVRDEETRNALMNQVMDFFSAK